MILGIIIGLLIALLILTAVKRYQTPIERTLRQLENKTKEHGDVFFDTDQQKEVETFINNLPLE